MEGGTSVDETTVRRWLEAAAASIGEQRGYLTQLDAAIGDADHGINLDRGLTAVWPTSRGWRRRRPGTS